MLLSIEVSLYCPRIAVLEVEDEKPKVVFTSCNDRHREALRSAQNRTPAGQILAEIQNKLFFALKAYPIDHVVWTMRRLGIANREASQMALGVILLTLHRAGHTMPEEMTGSSMRLYLTGDSKAPAWKVDDCLLRLLDNLERGACFYQTPIAAGVAWFQKNKLLP